ncbi:MAG: hypothetical protein ACRD43_08075 [Pyrinomonadaceae bacterium]
MKKTILIMFIGIVALHSTMAQAPKEANPSDVSSLDAVMRSVYDVISGDAAKPRDWDRFRSLFAENARLIPVRKDPQTGALSIKTYSVEEYVQRASPMMAKDGFFEREAARKVEQYGHIAHVFSTYESRHSLSDKTPFARGINSFQLFFDGKRWWVVSIYWNAETKDDPIPKKYLKN